MCQNKNRKYLIPQWSSETDVKMKLKYGKWLEALTVSIDIISANEKTPIPNQTNNPTTKQTSLKAKEWLIFISEATRPADDSIASGDPG